MYLLLSTTYLWELYGISIAVAIHSLNLFAQLVVGFSNPLAAHWKSLWTSVGRFLNLDLRSDQAHTVSFFTLGNGRGNLAPTIGHTPHINVNRTYIPVGALWDFYRGRCSLP